MAPSTGGHYVRLRSRGDDDNESSKYIDAQFRELPRRVPWKAILLAAGLFIVGTILLVLGCLFYTGHIPPAHEGDDRWLSMIILGSLMFIPGSYHTFIAVQTWRGIPGYDFDDIPHYDE
eukprot:TRINITY_DN20824_c0_g1_i1.p1 TRINITY_DN20824_c0_g1~~TRINITY_DN20824_c0_g1_i1.p1  ORF type:complete len:119 (+),score=3.93 TRINITY_DN20824_c0_g1_i1:86-442(+)